MAEKLFWVAAILLYGIAALLLINFHWTFWVAVILGTVAATIGNAMRLPDEGTPAVPPPEGRAAAL
ncbi:MAG: hypothetical protein MUF66_09810 [Gammaproteobacteria bacterium]|jgi:hypothetical protein|nr:hypothetical protein [Gammaproteobacteria bacterium]